jgi:predicted dithiol-disulfide oxidoreductase (DUF899 family)
MVYFHNTTNTSLSISNSTHETSVFFLHPISAKPMTPFSRIRGNDLTTTLHSMLDSSSTLKETGNKLTKASLLA